MDLDNQDPTTANDKTDSATPDFGAPIDASKLDEKPSFDMDAINQAVMATDGQDPNLQNSFDVNDISLDDVPTSQDELNSRLEADPNMSLAGGSGSDASSSEPVDLSGMVTEGNMGAVEMGAAMDMGASVEEKPATPAASFVDGDIIDEKPAEPAEETKPSATEAMGAINVDPIDGAISAPTPATEAPAEEKKEEKSEESNVADGQIGATITVPKPKSKLPLYIGIGVVALIAIIAIVVLIIAKS